MVIRRSKSEFRRLFEQGAIKVNGKKVGLDYKPNCGDIVKIGKKEFLRLVENGCNHKICRYYTGQNGSGKMVRSLSF